MRTAIEQELIFCGGLSQRESVGDAREAEGTQAMQWYISPTWELVLQMSLKNAPWQKKKKKKVKAEFHLWGLLIQY